MNNLICGYAYMKTLNQVEENLLRQNDNFIGVEHTFNDPFFFP